MKQSLKGKLLMTLELKLFLAALAVSSCTGTMAADFNLTCKDAYVNGSCTPKIEVTLNKQALYVQDSAGNTFWWGYNEPLANPPKPSWGKNVHYLTGKFTVLDGGITLSDLVSFGAKFGATERLADCVQFFGSYVCD